MGKRRKWLKAWLAIASLLAIAVLSLGGCGFGKEGVEVAPVAGPGEEEERPTPPPAALPAGNVILIDGEVVAAFPSLELAFSGNASARLVALDVQVGQRVTKGDRIAALDNGELRQEVEDAQIALDRAREDKAQAQADNEETYQRESEDVDDKYERERVDAEEALQTAEYNLQRARMEPPTTAVEEARVDLDRALAAEAEAADDYKQALDRPWEDQEIRDSLFKEWQERIVDRELAELRFQDAKTSLEVYDLDLEAKERDVENARADLARVKRDDVDKETDLTTYERAITDAEEELAQVREDLENAYLYAPWDGLVLSIETSVGAMVGSGTPVVTLLHVEDLYFITQNLSERHVAQLRKGQQAHITLRTFPDVVLTGRVETVVPQMDRQADSDARFTAYIRLDENELDLLPGMTGRVEIVTE
jgi:multidrug efflux pump subunit AcrA (membrane-fusion protein)